MTIYKKTFIRGITLLLIAGVLLLAANVAVAQDGEPADPAGDGAEVTADDVNVVAKTLYCPVCENTPLDVCETKACADWRAEIRTMLEEGRSEAEVQTYFEERYGRRVLATPKMEGFDLLVWVLPPLGVLTGVVVLGFTLRRMAPDAVAAQAQAGESVFKYDDLDPEYVERLEREVQEFASQT